MRIEVGNQTCPNPKKSGLHKMRTDQVPADFCAQHCNAWSRAGHCNVWAYGTSEECIYPNVQQEVRRWKQQPKPKKRG